MNEVMVLLLCALFLTSKTSGNYVEILLTEDEECAGCDTGGKRPAHGHLKQERMTNRSQSWHIPHKSSALCVLFTSHD